MQGEQLYTAVMKVYQTQEVFIDQVTTSARKLDDVFSAWVEQSVKKGFIKEPKNPAALSARIMMKIAYNR